MCKYEMDPMSILEDTERTRFCPQTDGRTDGQGDTSIPPFQLRWSGEYNYLPIDVLDTYRQISNISHTLVDNKIAYHSDVVGASPVGAAPTTSSFST